MTTFLDTNILIYLADVGAGLHKWSVDQLVACKVNGPALIADIVYCEFSVGMATQADVDGVIQQFGIERLPSDDTVLWRAATAYRDFLDKKKAQAKPAAEDSPKMAVLPDFLIGALAESAGAPLITNNPKDFISHFPKLKLIKP